MLDAADEQVEQFHQLQEADDMDGLWATTHAELRRATTREEFEGVMAQQKQIMGSFVSSERESFNINTNNGVTAVTVTMETEFANGSGTETFIFRDDNEEWQLLSYNITSPLYEQANGEAAVAEDAGANEPPSSSAEEAAPAAAAAPAPAPERPQAGKPGVDSAGPGKPGQDGGTGKPDWDVEGSV